MKNYKILYFITFTICAVFFSSCKSSNESEIITETNVAATDRDTVALSTESDYAILKAKTLELVKANQVEIAAFKSKLKTETALNKVKFQQEIDSLQAKNIALTSALNTYKEQGKIKLNSFKARLQKSIDDINKDIETYRKEHK